ncbi:MAG TPA: PfkB family carbohydrate kinase [Actinomycetota bacterium]|nr:PfkB family carbohydrate kinase [Actinomycetota bacterium]
MDAPPDVIVVGDVMVDVAVSAGALKRGGDVHGRVRIRPGGAGANAAAWAADAGAQTRLHGRVGDDLPGGLIRRALEERGLDAALAVAAGEPTGAMLVVLEAGERSMVAGRGANAGLSPEDLPGRLRAGAVLVSGYLLFHPGSEPAARAALDRADAGLVAIDAASWPLLREYGPERFAEATGRATMLLANRHEALALAGRDPEDPGAADPETLLGALSARYPIVVLKLGPAGAAASWDGRALTSTAPAVAEVDPTGAGDAFDGALLAGLVRGEQPEEALRRACEAGARAAASAANWPGA